MTLYKCKRCKSQGDRAFIRNHLKKEHNIKKDISNYMAKVEEISLIQRIKRFISNVRVF